ncbi:60S ribosomal protein L4B [Dimargaris cristalligena]|uniref:Ribosomal protein L4 domain-containing protein n=1 Tax=Dimargaris cristalligena TaxID=215637 RepID=A0A4P9ZSE9_9FUNG|nr:60S ribosomal protein L4B [Dimargaris cristalligena]RKP35622.1 ribosomal protein L4 domain-containing protein [Dimargaris cristalligena]|eukprot:RKP35622.1 ribosomal protein L4 domain-containing protein [Dimargaris cristalligena]
MSTVNRPVVNVFAAAGGAAAGTVALPAIFNSPIRPDVVQFVHTCMAKNNRQPYAVSDKAGHQTSAESWGTGRAVARIPRVSGGGTHRAGQAAFGNMCRGGRMFAPTKTWRKWHVKINLNQKRYATASALAATGVSALVLARGHRVAQIAEVPLVVSDDVESIKTTREAVTLLKSVNAFQDVLKVIQSRKIRAGRGKSRNRRHTQRRGPLVVYHTDNGVSRAMRNIPGVEIVNVRNVNLLQLAPGGHMGRFIIWTQSAFAQLDQLFGTTEEVSSLKSGYKLPGNMVGNSDIARIINSSEVQAALRPAGSKYTKRPWTQKKNPLRNTGVMVRLNPYSVVTRRAEILGAGQKKTKKAAKGKAGAKFLDMLKAD